MTQRFKSLFLIIFFSLTLFGAAHITQAAEQTKTKAKYKTAPQTFKNNPQVKDFIREMVRKYKFKESELNELFAKTEYKPSIIKAMKRPYEAKPWYEYQGFFITKQRIDGGKTFTDKHQDTLSKVEKASGVPQQIIVSIIGVESNYGQNKGKFRVVDALSTLAFKYPPRASFFRRELQQFLLLSREQKLPPMEVYGSYAGAIGFPQFMPSSYRHYAVDYDQDGHVDLGNSINDVIASVGNYLKENGWHEGEPIAVQAKIEGAKYKQLNTKNRKPNYTLKQLKQYGVTPATPIQGNPKVMLIELDQKDGKSYWIGFHNFYVITRYNTSKLYAMAVYRLSEDIKA